MKINECCSILPQECQNKRSLYERVMRAITVSLNANVSPAVKEQRVQWTTYSNLLEWFKNFRLFLTKFYFAGVDMNGKLEFADEQLQRIGNVGEMEIAIDGSQMRAGGRPAVSFHNPQLLLTSRAMSKSSLACTGIFGSNAAGESIPPHWQLLTSATLKGLGP
jgi:hypothetical protein